MTQVSWLILLAAQVVAPAGDGDEHCSPILNKIPYINRLFKPAAHGAECPRDVCCEQVPAACAKPCDAVSECYPAPCTQPPARAHVADPACPAGMTLPTPHYLIHHLPPASPFPPAPPMAAMPPLPPIHHPAIAPIPVFFPAHPVPPPAVVRFIAVPRPRKARQYLIQVKLAERRGGKDEVLMRPQLMLLEGQSGKVFHGQMRDGKEEGHWVELTVKRAPPAPAHAVSAPCCDGPCPANEVKAAPVLRARFAAARAAATVPAKPAAPATTIKVVELEGKPALEIRSGETSIVCGTMLLNRAGYVEMKVGMHDKQVFVIGEGIKAKADSITAGPDGTLTLEGKVRVSSAAGEVEVESGKVRIKPPVEEVRKTGVISAPQLVQ